MYFLVPIIYVTKYKQQQFCVMGTIPVECSNNYIMSIYTGVHCSTTCLHWRNCTLMRVRVTIATAHCYRTPEKSETYKYLSFFRTMLKSSQSTYVMERRFLDHEKAHKELPTTLHAEF